MFDCFWLSVPVQLIAWKDSSPNDLLCVEWHVKPYTLTHSLMRQNVEVEFSNIFADIISCAGKVGVEIIVPRIAGKQTHRSKPSSSSADEYYQRTVMIRVLDHVIAQLEERFGEIHQTVVKQLNLVPSNLISDPGDSQSMPAALQELAKLYMSDLPVPALLETEYGSWLRHWR